MGVKIFTEADYGSLLVRSIWGGTARGTLITILADCELKHETVIKLIEALQQWLNEQEWIEQEKGVKA